MPYRVASQERFCNGQADVAHRTLRLPVPAVSPAVTRVKSGRPKARKMTYQCRQDVALDSGTRTPRAAVKVISFFPARAAGVRRQLSMLFEAWADCQNANPMGTDSMAAEAGIAIFRADCSAGRAGDAQGCRGLHFTHINADARLFFCSSRLRPMESFRLSPSFAPPLACRERLSGMPFEARPSSVVIGPGLGRGEGLYTSASRRARSTIVTGPPRACYCAVPNHCFKAAPRYLHRRLPVLSKAVRIVPSPAASRRLRSAPGGMQ